MYSVRVESDFSAAHFTRCQGRCEQLHGHNYRVRLWAKGNTLNNEAMLVDFADLKNALRKVCKTLDHTNLNSSAAFTGDPTAECIARHIFDEVSRILDPAIAGLLEAVDVFETPGCMARYTCR